MFNCMLDMFSSEFRGELFSTMLELNYTLTESPSLIAIYKDEVKVAVELVRYLLLYADGSLDKVFELDEDEAESFTTIYNPSSDLIHDAYHNLYQIYEELD